MESEITLLPAENWLQDLKEYWVETEFNAQMDLLECYHEVGKRIVEAGHTDKVEEIASYLGRSKSTVYRTVQFYNKYPDINTLPEGKAITWRKVVQKYLPEKSRTRAKDYKIDLLPKPIPASEIVGSDSNTSHMFNELDYQEVVRKLRSYANFDPELKTLYLIVHKNGNKWGLTASSDRPLPKSGNRQPKCPNKKEGHKGCIQFIESFQESRGVKFANYPKQINALHKIIRAGYDWDQVNAQIDKMEANKFWSEKGFDLMSVMNELGKGGEINA